MKSKLVKDWMTPDPITITSNATLPEAYWMMINKKVRRLIILDGDLLAGIITLDDIRHAGPSTTIGFDLVKLSDQLCKMKVRQVMTKNPITIAQSATLIDAAQMMLENKISTLPVMEGSELAGIITESDIFRAFVERETR
jgi:acetoin utilization protein AcuB